MPKIGINSIRLFGNRIWNQVALRVDGGHSRLILWRPSGSECLEREMPPQLFKSLAPLARIWASGRPQPDASAGEDGGSAPVLARSALTLGLITTSLGMLELMSPHEYPSLMRLVLGHGTASTRPADAAAT